MKILISIIALFSASAFACPNISGHYVTTDGTHIKYSQLECATLTRFLGEVAEDGSVRFPDAGMLFILDGKPNCGIRDFCTTVTTSVDQIHFALNFTGGVETDAHGVCDQNGYTLSLDRDGNLVGDYSVFNCTDKFAGTAVKTFKKL